MNVKLIAAAMARLNNEERQQLADLLDEHVCKRCLNSGGVDVERVVNGVTIRRTVACECGQPMATTVGGARG